MKTKLYVAAACAALLSVTQTASAFAQAAARPAAAAPAVTHGPATPGVCILSVEAAITQSTVGRNVDTRMKQIIAQVQAELNAEQTAIQNEGKALETQRADFASKSSHKLVGRSPSSRPGSSRGTHRRTGRNRAGSPPKRRRCGCTCSRSSATRGSTRSPPRTCSG